MILKLKLTLQVAVASISKRICLGFTTVLLYTYTYYIFSIHVN